MVALPSAVSRYLRSCRSPSRRPRCPAGSRSRRASPGPAPTTTPSGPGATPARWPAPRWSRPWPGPRSRPWPGPSSGLDRLDPLVEAGDPVIFAANHHSHVDTPLLACSVPSPGATGCSWPPRPTTSSHSGDQRAVALVIGAIPIDRSRVSRRSADRAAGLIEDGWSMLIFPEGGRSPDGWGQPFRGRGRLPGAAVRGGGGARAPPGDRPHPAQGPQAAHPGHGPGHLRRPADPGRRR